MALDESHADDGAMYRFYAFWVRYRLRQGVAQALDDPAVFAKVLAAFEAEEAGP